MTCEGDDARFMSKNQEKASGKLCVRIRHQFLYKTWDEVTPIPSYIERGESSTCVKMQNAKMIKNSRLGSTRQESSGV